MKATNTRRPLQQQQNVPEQKGPFFTAKSEPQKKDDVFFQTKLAVGGKDDKFEKEADTAADKVQRKAEEMEKPEVQRKAEDKEQEPGKAVSQAGGAAGKDSKPAKGAAVPMPGEQKDKAGVPQQKTAKEEENKMVSRKEAGKEEEPAVQKKSEEKDEPVQKMGKDDKKEEDKTSVSKKEEEGAKEEPAMVMKEEAPGPAPAHSGAHKVSLEERIRKSKGKGQALPDEVRAFMESSLGADFSEVVLHTDGEAAAMNKELNALAFTNGFDIYFNAGQYRPHTEAGRKLLAHELAHVIQQTGVSMKKNTSKNGK